MTNWLVKLATNIPKTVATEPEVAPSPPTPHLDALIEKAATAQVMGRELAHRYPDVEKKAFSLNAAAPMAKALGGKVLGLAAKHPGAAMAAGGAAAGAIAGGKDHRLGGAALGAGAGGLASKMPMPGGKTMGQGLSNLATQGAAKVAPAPKLLPGMPKMALSLAPLKPLAGKALGLMAKHPGAALTAGGAAAGAVAGGPEHRLRGAMVGGGAGAGLSKVPGVAKAVGSSLGQNAGRLGSAEGAIAKASPNLSPLRSTWTEGEHIRKNYKGPTAAPSTVAGSNFGGTAPGVSATGPTFAQNRPNMTGGGTAVTRAGVKPVSLAA